MTKPLDDRLPEYNPLMCGFKVRQMKTALASVDNGCLNCNGLDKECGNYAPVNGLGQQQLQRERDYFDTFGYYREDVK